MAIFNKIGKSVLIGIFVGCASAWAEPSRVFDVTWFGAVGDGQSSNTAAFQAAIDACGEDGTVRINSGKYVTGTIKLKSGVELNIGKGAVIHGSTDLNDYARDVFGSVEAPAFSKCLIFAENAENIKITGSGTINGNGSEENFPVKLGSELGERPMLIRFVNCRNVTFSDVTLKDSASWCTHLVNCDDVIINGVKINSRVNFNNDGFDLDGCRNVVIENCDIRTGDDSICPKSTTLRAAENITVRNCRVSSGTAAFKCGTSSRGGFRNINVDNCLFYDCGMGAVKLLMVDGGVLEDINISNVTMDNVEGPFFIRLGNRGRKYDSPTEQVYSQDARPEGAEVGILRNVCISNIKAAVRGDDKTRQGIMISGIPGHNISGITFENIDISFTGNGTEKDAQRIVLEDIARYPEQFFFGVLPSWAMYIRHVDGILLKNVNFSLINPDKRPRIVAEDVENLRIY
ncbi:Exo-poly-alpha-D-galacturonosidase precursor [Limihaloglobus sulfuriphilus]|uniref:Exo-poly-alpha-D-galacturonosidase n=1 Tax=Limihaloglobus sulfuriphilus TaxID=1851148 RepID=A0A1Q2MDA2_9BACT|nr:glycoside hydrolase family 28 protein [Limihaloglobus sulfuriphilus]AQQ70242.1 Exo-poly-alpha-D-galacturonosidase precursor [Limihaloglobus sulfuriphilus]